MITKPLLAATIKDHKDIQFPCLVSYKLDGIRCLKINGDAVSRKFKLIPNHYIRNQIEMDVPDGVDGEIMIPGKNFNDVQSAVMSYDEKIKKFLDEYPINYKIVECDEGVEQKIVEMVTS